MRKLKTKLYSALGIGCFVLALFLLLTNACKNDKNVKGPASENPQDNVRLKTNDTGTPYVCVTNTADNSIEVYDYNSTTWDATTRLWSWKPTTALGYTSAGIAVYDTPNDQRVHYTTAFPGKATSIFAVASHQWIGIGSYVPDGTGGYVKGKKIWEISFAATENPNIHSVEILADGNVAVAGFGGAVSGKGEWVRVYNTSTTSSTNYASVPLVGAHAVLWDPALNILWAAGQITIGTVPYFGIFAYTIGGTRTAPTLTEITSRRSVKPVSTVAGDGGLRYPHDIQPDYDDTNILIYADHTGVYRYNKTTQVYTLLPGAAARYFNCPIKAAGKQQGGKYVMSEALNTGTCIYGTNKVDFYDGTTGALSFTRTVAGSCPIYRARIWTRTYN